MTPAPQQPATIHSLLDRILLSATNTGLDISLPDIQFIISLFLEGIAYEVTSSHIDLAVNKWLLMLADEVNRAKDQG